MIDTYEVIGINNSKYTNFVQSFQENYLGENQKGFRQGFLTCFSTRRKLPLRMFKIHVFLGIFHIHIIVLLK